MITLIEERFSLDREAAAIYLNLTLDEFDLLVYYQGIQSFITNERVLYEKSILAEVMNGVFMECWDIENLCKGKNVDTVIREVQYLVQGTKGGTNNQYNISDWLTEICDSNITSAVKRINFGYMSHLNAVEKLVLLLALSNIGLITNTGKLIKQELIELHGDFLDRKEGG